MASCTFEVGPNSSEFSMAVGRRLSEVVSDSVVQDFFELSGDESFEVRSRFDDNYRSVSGDYTVQDGDYVRLSRSSGTKG